MNPSASPTTRRTFLKQGALAGAVVAFPAILRAARPNSSIQLAAVGVTGMGGTDLHNFSAHAKVKYVGLCDIDSRNFPAADKIVPGVPHFADFRVMLEKLGDTVDAIHVSIPDHMHALVAIEAMKRGKHVYCQKPLAHTVWECRQMKLWAEKTGVVTQMGNQGHSSEQYRMATRMIRDGVIGKVKEVHSFCQLTGNERTRLLEPPATSDTPPREVDWNLWIGSAPMRPYVRGIYHPFAWRDWQDFGGGAALGDFGCHVLDPVFTALGLKAPISVAADNSGINRYIWPTTETIQYIFPGNEFIAGPTLKVIWTDGGLRPEKKLAKLPPEIELPKTGSVFVGEKGSMVLPHLAAPRFYPVEDFKGLAYPKDVKGQSHWHRWVDAIIEGTKTTDAFDYASALSETIQLGNVATRACKAPPPKRGSNTQGARQENVMKWDAENLRFTNNDVANKLLTKAYRSGFEVPAANGVA